MRYSAHTPHGVLIVHALQGIGVLPWRFWVLVSMAVIAGVWMMDDRDPVVGPEWGVPMSVEGVVYRHPLRPGESHFIGGPISAQRLFGAIDDGQPLPEHRPILYYGWIEFTSHLGNKLRVKVGEFDRVKIGCKARRVDLPRLHRLMKQMALLP